MITPAITDPVTVVAGISSISQLDSTNEATNVSHSSLRPAGALREAATDWRVDLPCRLLPPDPRFDIHPVWLTLCVFKVPCS
jgi:hypothetical protein